MGDQSVGRWPDCARCSSQSSIHRGIWFTVRMAIAIPSSSTKCSTDFEMCAHDAAGWTSGAYCVVFVRFLRVLGVAIVMTLAKPVSDRDCVCVVDGVYM